MAEKLVIIDGNSIFYRSFYALPLLSNKSGKYSNAIYGFAIQIINIIQNIKPNYIVVSFDAAKKTFRNEMFTDYKANRKPMPPELREQLEPLKEMLTLMNIKYVEKVGIEGDDIIGVISKRFKDTENIIVTGDRDSFQLIDNNVKVYFTKKGTSELKVMGIDELNQEYGVTPEQFIDLKSLQGDTSDNIPGVEGIGPKTAVTLIQNYKSLDGIYENLDNISSSSLREKLIKGKENAYMSKSLATILTQDSFKLELSECKFDYPFSSDVYSFFSNYEFKTLLRNKENFKTGIGEENTENQVKSQKITKIEDTEKIKDYFELANKSKKFAFYIHSNEIHFSVDNIEEIVFNLTVDLLSNGINEFAFYDIFKPLFESNDVEKICFDSKKEMYHLKQFGTELNNYFDISVARYLVDGIPVDKVADLLGDESINTICVQLMEYSQEYKEKIESEDLKYLYYDVELPLTKVLFSMENEGFKVDKDILFELKSKYDVERKELEKSIFDQAGEVFNLNSTKQLATILYDKLKLPNKKHMSTSAEVLQELSPLNPIIDLILRYRKITKFLSTYIDGLLPHIDSKNLIHTYFKQTLTTTGRLSSVEPNLQNIPIRSEESREIRSMFVASDENHVLIDADYSQIELRLLTHLSQDKKFIEAFNENIDIHSQTACDVFGVTPDLVTPQMRRTAKIVNFGVIYGISEFGLAEDLKTNIKEAKNYIENFYAMHKEVREFMDNLVAKTKNTGEAKTLFGRTRKMPEINSPNYMIRQRAERACQNMPLQGTAADIVKIAMVKTYNALKANNLKSKLIMQIHDELIINAPVEEKEIVEKLLKDQMESAVKLLVPLEVDVKSSYRWSDGH